MIMETIKKVIEKETKLSLSVRSRKREYLFARALYYKLCKEETAYSLQKIGDSLGFSHANVMHSINKIYPEIKKYDTDSYYAYLKCQNLTKKIKEQQFNLLNEAINE
jgi:chromosomal replication initiation ATPase DnaA